MPHAPLKLRPVADIPNTEGLSITIVTKEGDVLNVRVAKRPDGTHHLPGYLPSELRGWLPRTP